MADEPPAPTQMDSAVLVLEIVKEGGTIPGRTSLQKISYFTNELTGNKISFKPHLYGPFSPEIAVSSDMLVSARLLHEEIERGSFVRSGNAREWTRHSYSLTRDGQRYLQWLGKKSHLPEAKISAIVSELRTQTKLDPDSLSKLAKVHFIRKSSGISNPTPAMISRLAKSYDWNLPIRVARQSLIRLQKLSL